MNLYNELLNGLGYAVCPIENMNLFKKLRDSFVDNMNIPNNSDKNINYVRKAIAKMSNAEGNKSMINLLKFTDLSEMIIGHQQYPHLN